jgi:hypothetical protein
MGPKGVFVSAGSMTVARVGHTATLLSSGKVLIAGGYDDYLTYANYLTYASAELYDRASGTFAATGV